MSDQTWLEDIAADIGYTATCKIVGWYGGKKLAVPTSVENSSVIPNLIGTRAYAILVREYGGMSISIPNDSLRDSVRRDRIVHGMLLKGASIRDIGDVCSLSPRHVLNIKIRLEEMGMLVPPAEVNNGVC